jgi:hypothetical protein
VSEKSYGLSFQRRNIICPFMNSNVKNVETSLNSCALPVTIKTIFPALHAGEKKVKDCCPLFHQAHQVPARDLEALRHPRPVLLPADFPERDDLQPGAVSSRT